METKTQPESTGNDDPPQDESPYTKTYIAIDGVKCDDFSEEQEEKLVKAIVNMCLLDFQKPITGVRVLREQTILEVD